MILAETTPYRAAPRVAGEGRIRPAQQQALELATVLVPRAMGFDAKNPDGWAVQLGAYDSLAVAKEKWGTLKKRNDVRSEEHTSELQSLMRISYAVFCLKKKI